MSLNVQYKDLFTITKTTNAESISKHPHQRMTF
jgi:hypothetical protein